jgi:hypothetical protein
MKEVQGLNNWLHDTIPSLSRTLSYRHNTGKTGADMNGWAAAQKSESSKASSSCGKCVS